MEVRVRHGKDKQSEAFARFHRVVCDQTFDDGGSDCGMTPPELMLSAIGCCAMHYAAEYLRARNLGLDKIELKITAEKGGRPLRLVEIGIEVDAPGLSNRSREGLMKAVEACLLHRTLLEPPKVKVGITPLATDGPAATAPANLTS